MEVEIMTVMDSKSFWLNSAAGAGTVAVVCLIGWLADIPVRINPSQEYVAYSESHAEQMQAYEMALADYEERSEQREAWIQRNHDALEQRCFEEAVAGLRSVYDVRDPGLRRLARTLTMIRRANANDDDALRAANISRLLIDEGGQVTANRLQNSQGAIRCNNNLCNFRRPAQVLGEPDRLALLLKGDATGVDASLPHYPPELPVAPAAPILATSTTRLGPLPDWWPIGLWCALSMLFMLGFVIRGYVAHAMASERDKPSRHPLRSIPSSVLGWMTLLVVLPGTITAQGLLLLVSDARPTFHRLKHWAQEKFSRRTFTDDYERFNTQLETIKTRATRTGDNELLQRVERLSVQVEQRQSREELRTLMSQLENIGCYLEAQNDLEAFEERLQ